MPGRKRRRRRRSASRRSTRPPGWNWPMSRPWPADRSSRLVPGDVSDSFALGAELIAVPKDRPPSRNRVMALGLFGSLGLHLLPLLLLLSWGSAPADRPSPPIQVQVVFEAPPPPPLAPAKKAPPRGRLASEGLGGAA